MGNIKPSAWRYLVPAILFAAAIIVFFFGRGKALEMLDASGQRIELPGTATIEVEERSMFYIYYEYTGEPKMEQEIAFVFRQTGGDTIAESRRPANDMGYQVGEIHGIPAGQITFNRPGTYQMDVDYPDGPELSFRLHQGILWQPLAMYFGTLAVAGLLAVIGLIHGIATLIRRLISRRELALYGSEDEDDYYDDYHDGGSHMDEPFVPFDPFAGQQILEELPVDDRPASEAILAEEEELPENEQPFDGDDTASEDFVEEIAEEETAAALEALLEEALDDADSDVEDTEAILDVVEVAEETVVEDAAEETAEAPKPTGAAAPKANSAPKSGNKRRRNRKRKSASSAQKQGPKPSAPEKTD